MTGADLPAAARALPGRLAALSRPRRWAAAASALWAVLVGGYAVGFFATAGGALGRGTVFLDGMFFLAALALPLVLVWLAAWLAEELARQREVAVALAELAAPLYAALDGARVSLERHRPVSLPEIERAVHEALAAVRPPDPAADIARLRAGQARIEAAVQGLVRDLGAPAQAPAPAPSAPEPAPRPKKPRARPAPSEPALPLLPQAEAPARPGWAELVRALDFPRDAQDREGFRALEAALRHHTLAQMLQAAEDVLNLLSQEGIYMDDLEVGPCDPEAWRRFVAGSRGAEVQGMGAVTDARALEAARGLMRSDSIFRDTALFFQRRFDVVLSEFAGAASDAELARLADTRCGRAFMLLARLSGSFG